MPPPPLKPPWPGHTTVDAERPASPAQQTKQPVSSKQPAKPAKMKLNNLSLRPAERVLSAFGNTQDDAEAALARAEAEQQAGVPLPLESTAPELQAENKESIQQQEQVTEKDGAAESQASKKRKATAPKPAWYEMDDTKNTHVYVTGLPPDITEKQFAELMSKYGVIMNEPFTNKLRAKLYLDSSGKPKGDGRCCYVKRLALQPMQISKYSRQSYWYTMKNQPNHAPNRGETSREHEERRVIEPNQCWKQMRSDASQNPVED
ncbi:unnamed protein product [Calicophoron daubneyi]|uniref:RRM domain-containing protein n=1 Tax=Calicophoron daubneyi TaxID=300641 RepID=A0AAV2U1Z9_CALDB